VIHVNWFAAGFLLLGLAWGYRWFKRRESPALFIAVVFLLIAILYSCGNDRAYALGDCSANLKSEIWYGYLFITIFAAIE
jgi:hypothetical protein